MFCFRSVAVRLKGVGVAGACRVFCCTTSVLWLQMRSKVPQAEIFIVLRCSKLVRLSLPSGGQASASMFEHARFSWPCTNCSKRVWGTYEQKLLKKEELKS